MSSNGNSANSNPWNRRKEWPSVKERNGDDEKPPGKKTPEVVASVAVVEGLTGPMIELKLNESSTSSASGGSPSRTPPLCKERCNNSSVSTPSSSASTGSPSPPATGSVWNRVAPKPAAGLAVEVVKREATKAQGAAVTPGEGKLHDMAGVRICTLPRPVSGSDSFGSSSGSTPERRAGSRGRVKNLPETSTRPLRRVESLADRQVLAGPGWNRIPVTSNHFFVEFTKNFPSMLYHYDVVIQSAEGNDPSPPTVDSTLPDRILPKIWETFETTFADVLKAKTPFDGKKNCYSAKLLTFEGMGECITEILEMDDPDDPDKIRKFRIKVKKVAEVSTASVRAFLDSGRDQTVVDLPQDVIQALDVALRYAPGRSQNTICCNRSFFTLEGRDTLSPLLDLCYGHFQSLYLGSESKATLNVDLASKAFYKKMPLIDYLRKSMGLNSTDSFDLKEWAIEDIAKASEHLKGKLIEYGTGSYNCTSMEYEKSHRFPANGLMAESADSYRFVVDTTSNRKISISTYMQEFKATKIEHGSYPVVHIGSSKRTNYVPLELCSMIPQAYRGKMDANLTSTMIKKTAIKPEDRFRRIMFALRSCEFEQCEVLKEFGLKVSTTCVKLDDAKRLHPPKIETLNARRIKDSLTPVDRIEGKWAYSRGQGEKRFFSLGAVVPPFALMVCTYVRDESILTRFLNDIAMKGEDHGMHAFRQQRARATIHNVHNEMRGGKRLSQLVNQTLSDLKKKEVKLVVVVVGTDGKEYATVKSEAEVSVGILTACIKLKNVMELKPQTIGNWLLKLNSKLNGINFSVPSLREDKNIFGNEPVIIFGADVTHPAPNSKAPSVAAVTASFNLEGMAYNVHIQPQASRQEVIDNLGNIVKSMIRSFYHRTGGKFPTKLIMFRDGVSEGYFDEIKAKEFEQISSVCREVELSRALKAGTIKITFIVVKKRHHTRFQPVRPSDGVGRFCNIPPGTVVDTTIVHPAEQEYFLNSHVGIQGTSKPTRYHVIHDDSKFSMLDLQKMTYYLCYTFVRCTQPVSYPAATYYAHLAAYRARHLIEREGETADLALLTKRLTLHPDILKEYPMFFV